MKIYTPVKDFNGVRQGVRFINGVGETDKASLISWFKSHGYRIEDYPKENKATFTEIVDTITNFSRTDDEQFVDINKLSDEPDFESMTPNELRDWAKEHGLGNKIKTIRNREKLLEIIRG